MRIILIDPYFCNAYPYDDKEEETLKNAIESFWSSVWEQGGDPDGKILSTYGDWTVYIKEADGTLKPQGMLEDLVDSKGRVK